MHAGSWADRQVVPLFRSCAANHPEISSSPCPELEYPLVPPITTTKCLFNCCLCVRSMRLQASRHSRSSCSFPHLACAVVVLLNTSRFSVAEVMTYTVPARPMRLLDFLDLQAPCPCAPLSSQ